MLRKTITYIDYNGVERTEDFFFNLTKAELIEIEMGTTGGLVEMVNRIVAAQDAPAIIKVFKDLVLKAYGQKSPDGRAFIKTDELRKEFESTEAYSELFVELSTNAEAAADFVNGIMPSDSKVSGTEKNQAITNKVESLPIK
jgi:hypothetical protein